MDTLTSRGMLMVHMVSVSSSPSPDVLLSQKKSLV